MSNKAQGTDSLVHTTWHCRYHVVFAPKIRSQVIYGKIKGDSSHRHNLPSITDARKRRLFRRNISHSVFTRSAALDFCKCSVKSAQ